MIDDPLLKPGVDSAVMHGSVHEVEVAAVLPEVADQRPEPIGTVPDEFGDQPKLKADRGNEVVAYRDGDVVLPRAGPGAFERVGFRGPFDGAEPDVDSVDREARIVLTRVGEPYGRGQAREFRA
ncbi:hypothetical protein [Actinoplanes philippinensis]|uniref:hypothetical protein n=1 Tax=Actinoplanes philippinensis TaxID=35752 RepID=UPI003408BEEE